MPNRRHFLMSAMSALAAAGAAPARRPNVLLITADDMNWNSPGAFGNPMRGITPNIDRLASEGLCFLRAHVTAAVCQPSRSVLMTGRYPHRNGAEGFQPIRTEVPTLQEQLREAGYLNGILAKTGHLAPRSKFCWDTFVTAAELGQGRDPALYYRHSREFFERAKSARKPFFLMANAEDPHRPFAGSLQELNRWKDKLPEYRRKIQPEEAAVPGFLPDIPAVRQEVAEYFTSVHRCDETAGEVLRALRETGFEQDTLVMFLSDNGMAFPFAKTNCYLNSTRTPWLARWPGRIRRGAVDSRHLISGIDFMPTVLEAAGLPQTPGMDGASFLPVLQGKTQRRDHVFTVFHETSARQRFEMRAVQNARFGYIFNAWADGKRVFRNESQSGLTFKAMQEAAAADRRIAERVRLFQYRVPEELYDFQSDPDALNNLIGSPGYKAEAAAMRARMREWMKSTADPLLAAYRF